MPDRLGQQPRGVAWASSDPDSHLKERGREVEQLRREVARLQAENAFLRKVSA